MTKYNITVSFVYSLYLLLGLEVLDHIYAEILKIQTNSDKLAHKLSISTVYEKYTH